LSSSGSRPPRAQRAMSDGNMAIGNCCRAMLLWWWCCRSEKSKEKDLFLK
jgi:hypothetical protein